MNLKGAQLPGRAECEECPIMNIRVPVDEPRCREFPRLRECPRNSRRLCPAWGLRLGGAHILNVAVSVIIGCDKELRNQLVLLRLHGPFRGRRING